MIQAGSGQSLRTDARDAIHEAIDEAREQFGSGSAVVAFVFATSHHQRHFQDILQILMSRLQTQAVLASTGSGVVGPRGEIENTPGLSILLLAGDRISARATVLPHPESPDAVDHLRTELPSLYREPGTLILAASPRHLHPDFIQRLSEALPDTPVIGAAAGWCTPDQIALTGADGDSSNSGCAALHLGGCIESVIGVAQGVTPEMEPIPISQADGNSILSIDSKPAADVLAEFIQALRDQSRGHAPPDVFCAIADSPGDFKSGRYLVRNIIGVEPATKDIIIADLARTGQFIAFGVREPAGARRSYRQMLERVNRSLAAKSPRAALLFNCCARGRSLYARPHVDLDAFREFFPELPLAGFFGFSEIGPVLASGRKSKSVILNYTAVLSILTEPMEMLGTP